MYFIDLRGVGRSGKGSIGKAIEAQMKQIGLKTTLVDQGKKYRFITSLILEISNNDVSKALTEAPKLLIVDNFVEELIEYMRKIQMRGNEAVNSLLYSDVVNEIVAEIGKDKNARLIAGSALLHEMSNAHEQKNDLFIFDGRSFSKHFKALKNNVAGGVVKLLSFYINCDPLTAAERMSRDGDSRPIIDIAQSLRSRNRNDMTRQNEPLIPPERSFRFSYHYYDRISKSERKEYLLRAIKNGVVSIATQETDSVNEMTSPILDMVNLAYDGRNSRL